MRIIYLIFLSGLLSLNTFSQQRQVHFRSIGRDSIKLHLDENYFLIEDTCSSIIRYSHFNFQERHFFGSFRDLNKLDPMIILSEGTYSPEGKLDGAFNLKYLNGNVQATGRFINGMMDGAWELFYEDGKPWMSFKVTDTKIRVENAWNKSGKIIVEAGNGDFKADLNSIYWEGKLVNGSPDGTWRARPTDDHTNTIISSENFKKGLFVKGSGPLGAYSDFSRIVLVSPDILPISNAALMQVSPTACDPSMSRKKVISAIYHDGIPAFTEEVKRFVSTFLNKTDFKSYYITMYDLVLEGQISEKGYIENLRLKSGFSDKISTGLIRELQMLPRLEPASINGQAVKQNLVFTFRFSLGSYTYSYQFLPVKS